MHPHVTPLRLSTRKIVFGGLFLLFVVVLPLFIFYATGYRYDFSASRPALTVTGAFYIFAEAPESTIYLDDQLVTSARSFRNASYIQGMSPGVHRVHVQAPGAHTWVKELTISPRIVTEAEAFNLPLTPQVRLVPAYLTTNGEGVIFARSSSSPVLSYVATSTPLVFATSTATTTYRANAEYALLRDLFMTHASNTAARESALARERESFGFATTTLDWATLGTTTVTRGSLTLYEAAGEIFARAEPGNFRQVPFYFCAPTLPALETEVVGVDGGGIETSNLYASSSISITATSSAACRTEIQIDRQGKVVTAFDFYPANANLVLLLREDGVFVTEIDDRAWQNTQPLYRGENLALLVYRDAIYLKEGELIFEVLPEIVSR